MRSEKWEELLFNSWNGSNILLSLSLPLSLSLCISAFMHTYGFKPGMKRSAVIRSYGTSEVRIRGYGSRAWIISRGDVWIRGMDGGYGPPVSPEYGSEFDSLRGGHAGAGTLYRVLPNPFASCAPSSRYLHLWPQVVSPHYQCQYQMHQCGFQANTFHTCPTLQLVASLWPDLITVILINRTEIHHGPTG